jgi:hypothetical protein
MLLNATAESPFAQVSSVVEVAEKILGLEHVGVRETETATTKEVSALTAGKGEIRTMSITDYESRLRREGSIASQITIDALPVGGSTSGWTSDAIYWFISYTLNQLGEKWLGNPLVTLAGLIPAPTMAKVKAMTSQEIANHMIFHLVNVSILQFSWVIYPISIELTLSLSFTGLHA